MNFKTTDMMQHCLRVSFKHKCWVVIFRSNAVCVLGSDEVAQQMFAVGWAMYSPYLMEDNPSLKDKKLKPELSKLFSSLQVNECVIIHKFSQGVEISSLSNC